MFVSPVCAISTQLDLGEGRLVAVSFILTQHNVNNLKSPRINSQYYVLFCGWTFILVCVGVLLLKGVLYVGMLKSELCGFTQVNKV